MQAVHAWKKGAALATTLLVALLLGGCWGSPFGGTRAAAPREAGLAEDWTYRIGPLDTLNIFVWRNPELSQTVTVRPDGRFSTPLVKEYPAAGKTPPELATELERQLSEFVRDPLVTVTVSGFSGEYADQVRVVGEAVRPVATPYRKRMTALDLLIQVGGLTPFAAGNRAVLVRYAAGKEDEFRLRLDDLVRDGDISANVALQPGDVVIIPEAWF